MLKYSEKAKLAIKIVDRIYSLYVSNSGGLALDEDIKEIMEYWKKNTMKPFSKEDYYRRIDAMVAHLRKPLEPWQEKR